MTANRLDPSMRNNEIGLYPAKSRLAYDGVISSDAHLGETATWLRAITGGWITYHNPINGEDCVEYLQDGEKAPIVCDIIYSATAVDGKTTTAQTVVFYTTPDFF